MGTFSLHALRSRVVGCRHVTKIKVGLSDILLQVLLLGFLLDLSQLIVLGHVIAHFLHCCSVETHELIFRLGVVRAVPDVPRNLATLHFGGLSCVHGRLPLQFRL